MNISYKWLKEYVDFSLTPQETADALTSCGLEVDALEEVQTIKGGLKGLAKGAWTKLGGFARNFGIKSLTKTVTKFGIKTLVKGAGIAGLAWTILLLVIHGILYILKHFFVFIVAIAVILTAILESLGAAFGVFIFLVLLLIVANSVIE